jgi:hypothetical protein
MFCFKLSAIRGVYRGMKKIICFVVLWGLAGVLRAQDGGRFAGVDGWLEANTRKMGVGQC